MNTSQGVEKHQVEHNCWGMKCEAPLGLHGACGMWCVISNDHHVFILLSICVNFSNWLRLYNNPANAQHWGNVVTTLSLVRSDTTLWQRWSVSWGYPKQRSHDTKMLTDWFICKGMPWGHQPMLFLDQAKSVLFWASPMLLWWWWLSFVKFEMITSKNRLGYASKWKKLSLKLFEVAQNKG